MVGRARWGTGREDYSNNIEVSTVPFVSSHQYRMFVKANYNLIPYTMYTIEAYGTYGMISMYPNPQENNWLIYYAKVSLDSNVLIKARFDLYNVVTGQIIPKQTKYGYGEVSFIFPKGYLITKEQFDNNWTFALSFLPGGYYSRLMIHALKDVLA